MEPTGHRNGLHQFHTCDCNGGIVSALSLSWQQPSEAVRRSITELRRIVDALAEVITPETFGQWMITPNGAFNGLKPLEVIEHGEVDRIWQMIFILRSGVPC